MDRSRLRLRRITYAININRLAEDVYYCKTREIAREFIDLDRFIQTVLSYSDYIARKTLEKMYFGFEHLFESYEKDFSNLVLDDNCFLEEDVSLSHITTELLENMLQHFCYMLAFHLLDTTDVEEFMDDSIELSNVTKYNVTFTYED